MSNGLEGLLGGYVKARWKSDRNKYYDGPGNEKLSEDYMVVQVGGNRSRKGNDGRVE